MGTIVRRSAKTRVPTFTWMSTPVCIDNEGDFKRMFIGLGSAVRIAITTGIEFSGIDGTFFKHVYFHEGVALLLVTRDGNNELICLAWVVCLVEDAPNYNYMAKHAKKMIGLSQYLNRERHVLYSDRQKGIPSFEREFTAFNTNCIVHIVRNLRDHLRKKPGAAVGFHSNQVHRIQQCNTRKEYLEELNLLRRGFPEAAEYLDKLPHDSTYL